MGKAGAQATRASPKTMGRHRQASPCIQGGVPKTLGKPWDVLARALALALALAFALALACALASFVPVALPDN